MDAVTAAPASADALAHLTRRQRQVAQGLARRLTYKQIAAELGLTHRTVEIYAAGLFRRLKVHSRHAAVAALQDTGLAAAAGD